MLNQLVRYAPVLRKLRDESGSILEVGSGVDGISAYLRRPVVGLEISYYAQPGPYLRPVRGTATHLPFRDGSVDVVLIMDTLEHIPHALRRRCLDEAMRVAGRRIIVGGPMGPGAREADERLAAYYQGKGIDVPDWLSEHLAERAPDTTDIEHPLRAAGWDVRVEGNENLRAHLALMRLETHEFAFRVLGRIRRHASRPVAAIARALSFGPYYSSLVDARRRSSASDHAPFIRSTNGPQS